MVAAIKPPRATTPLPVTMVARLPTRSTRMPAGMRARTLPTPCAVDNLRRQTFRDVELLGHVGDGGDNDPEAEAHERRREEDLEDGG